MWIYRNIGTRKHSHKRNGFIYFKRTRQFSVCQLPCNNNQKKRILQHINNMQNNTNTNRHTHTQKDLRKWIFIIGFCVCCVVSPIFYDYNSIGISFVFFFCFLCGDIEKSSYSAFSITIVCVCVDTCVSEPKPGNVCYSYLCYYTGNISKDLHKYNMDTLPKTGIVNLSRKIGSEQLERGK